MKSVAFSLLLVGFFQQLLLLSLHLQSANAFTTTVGPISTKSMTPSTKTCTPALQQQQSWKKKMMTTTATTKTQLSAVTYDVVEEIGFGVVVEKPMGVIFGENKDPYYGLTVDDISEGLNGARAGIRIGDQLLSVNGQVVVGKDFDSVMNILQSESKALELLLYRGPVSTLYTILSNKLGDEEDVRDEEISDDDEDSIPVIMDENYEPPVIDIKPAKKLTPGDFFKAMQKGVSMLTEDLASTDGSNNDEDDDASAGKAAEKPKKKNTGFFGIGGDTIQLDGDDATTLKQGDREKKEEENIKGTPKERKKSYGAVIGIYWLQNQKRI